MKKLTISLCTLISACSTAPIRMPPEVALKQVNGAPYIDTISFDFPSSNAKVLIADRAMRCALSNITATDTTLSDSSGSFVGPYTGQFYQRGNSSTVAAGQVIQGYDKESGFFAAAGSTTYSTGSLVPIAYSIKYLALIAPETDRINITLKNIVRAQKDTGVAANRGFIDVGAWEAASPLDVYNPLKSIADKVGSCLTSK